MLGAPTTAFRSPDPAAWIAPHQPGSGGGGGSGLSTNRAVDSAPCPGLAPAVSSTGMVISTLGLVELVDDDVGGGVGGDDEERRWRVKPSWVPERARVRTGSRATKPWGPMVAEVEAVGDAGRRAMYQPERGRWMVQRGVGGEVDCRARARAHSG